MVRNIWTNYPMLNIFDVYLMVAPLLPYGIRIQTTNLSHYLLYIVHSEPNHGFSLFHFAYFHFVLSTFTILIVRISIDQDFHNFQVFYRKFHSRWFIVFDCLFFNWFFVLSIVDTIARINGILSNGVRKDINCGLEPNHTDCQWWILSAQCQ